MKNKSADPSDKDKKQKHRCVETEKKQEEANFLNHCVSILEITMFFLSEIVRTRSVPIVNFLKSIVRDGHISG